MRPRPVHFITLTAFLIPLTACSGTRPTISGRYLVALADGDMINTTLADGLLMGPSPTTNTPQPDTLTVARLPLPNPGATPLNADIIQEQVSNSSLGPPRLLAVDHLNNRALVLATRGHAPDGATLISDLPQTGLVSLVDLLSATTIAELDLGPGASSIALHPDLDLAVVMRTTPSGHEADLLRVDPDNVSLVGRLPITDAPASPSISTATAAFSPDGHTLAITFLGADSVVFYQVLREGSTVGLGRWGAPVTLPNYPYMGAWSPDSSTFYVASTLWGDAANRSPASAPNGLVTPVRLAPNVSPDAAHEALTPTTVGVGPEGLTIHPSGNYLATANVRRSFLFPHDPSYTRGGSMTILRVNPDTHELTALAEYDCGAGPQGITFDPAGAALLVTDYEAGAVQVWSFDASTGKAQFTGVRLHVGRGAHAVEVVP